MDRGVSYRTYGAFILIVLGAGMILDQLGLVPFGMLFNQWWPVLIIMLGVFMLLRPGSDSFWPLAIVAVGMILLVHQLNYVQVDIWSLFWPVVLLILGVRLLAPQKHPERMGPSPEAVQTDTDKSVVMETYFGNQERKIDTHDFTGGRITNWFGSTRIDLRQAVMAEQATLDITVAFGTVEIWVAEDCRVVIHGAPVLGGWEDKTIRPAESTQTLILIGTCVAGLVSIKN
jgi:predicted membrane protein